MSPVIDTDEWPSIRDTVRRGTPPTSIAEAAECRRVWTFTAASWFNPAAHAQADVDDGKTPGTTTADARRIADLEQENRELRRANEILKRAATFFGAELDRQSRR